MAGTGIPQHGRRQPGRRRGKDRKQRHQKSQLAYASDGAVFSVLAAKDAVDDAGLTEADLQSPRTGCIVGSGVGGLTAIYQARKRYTATR